MDQIIEESPTIDHITSIDRLNIGHRHHTDSKIPDANLHIGIQIIQETIQTIDIEINHPDRAIVTNSDIDRQPHPNIQDINQELIAVQNTHLGQACSAKNAAHSEITTNTPARLTITIAPTNAPNAKKVIITPPNARQNADRLHHSRTTNR
jgi:hypothetical protein